MLQSMGSQWVRHNWATEMNWTDRLLQDIDYSSLIHLQNSKPLLFVAYVFFKIRNLAFYSPGIAFFLQSSRYVSNEQSCLKTSGLYDDLLLLSSLFHFFYFIFSAPISFSLCVLISPSLLSFWCSFSYLYQV